MIVLGADTYKRSHTIAAVAAVAGEQTFRSAGAGALCCDGRAASTASA